MWFLLGLGDLLVTLVGGNHLKMCDHGHDDHDHDPCGHDPCDHGDHGDHDETHDHDVRDAFHELHGHLPCDDRPGRGDDLRVHDHHGVLRDYVHESDHHGVLHDLLGGHDDHDHLNVHANDHGLLDSPDGDRDHVQGLQLHHPQR